MFRLTILCFCVILYSLFSVNEPKSLVCIVKPIPPLSQIQINVIYSLTNIAENSQTDFDWTYAQNIGDGRGITFGIIGFCSGTYDGTQVIKKINELDPTNELTEYLPAFEAIDNSPHNAQGLTDDVQGLDNFIADFNEHGADPVVKEAQLYRLQITYWDPAIDKAKEIGCEYPLTIAQLYDICINFGAESGGGNSKGLKELVEDANNAVGSLISGTNEVIWLNALYDVREIYMNSDPAFAQAIDRVEMHRRILMSGNLYLQVPFNVTCYGDPFIVTGETP